MDVDFKTPHQENGAKTDDDSPQKSSTSPDETNGTAKESPKQSTRQRRSQRSSRSRTPQKKLDDGKTLHVTLKKYDTELNGKDIIEELEKTDEIKEDANAKGGIAKKEQSLKEDTTNVEEATTMKEKQSKKQKQASPKKEETNKKEEILEKGEAVSKKESPKKEKREKNKKQDLKQTNEVEPDSVEMDPLVISDGPDPELQFDENSDMESGKGSPIIPRCITRRSQTRNIPTPKTPKSMDQDVESEKITVTQTSTELPENDMPKTEVLNDSRDSSDTTNLSTRAEAGSDVTRMDYIDTHSSDIAEDTSYLEASRERSLSETLRCLSARRPIRQTDDYRRRVLRNNQEQSDLNMPYTSRSSVEQVTTGLKRKSRSATPEDRKKFKAESSSLNSLFSSPLTNFRNRFKTDLPSSTPKLRGYKDNKSSLHYNDDDFTGNGDDEKKSWCSIM